MKKIFLLAIVQTIINIAYTQTYFTKNGFAGFYSSTPLENIQAENNQVYAIMDISKKSMAVSMLLKGFIFKKELMQEHFNENYVESDKYPKATFTGTFSENIIPSKNETITLHLNGTLTLHGISKPFSTTATLEIKNNVLNGESNFTISPQDFNIQIPSLVKEKITKEIKVQIKISLHP